MTIRRAAYALLLTLCIQTALAYGQIDGQQKNLRGITEVSVSTASISAEAEKNGLSKRDVQAAVEARLRKAGVKVLTQSAPDVPLYPQLSVRLNLHKDDDGTYALALDVNLNRVVNPKCGGSLFDHMVVIVWRSGAVGTVSADKMPALKGYIEELVDDFAKDVVASNQ